MAVKVYLANTPLILQAADGTEFRVEAGEAVELTAAQYEEVAAHVTAGEIRAEDLAASGETADGMPSPSEDKSESEAAASAPSDTAETAPAKRSRKTKAE